MLYLSYNIFCVELIEASQWLLLLCIYHRVQVGAKDK